MKIKIRNAFFGLMSGLLLLAGSAATASAQVNLVQNGSFESPEMPSPYSDDGSTLYFYKFVSPGYFAPWVNAGTTMYGIRSRAGGWIAQDGNQYVEVDSGFAGFYQQTLTTVPGETYTLQFWYSPNSTIQSPNDDATRVLWDGVQVDIVDETSMNPGSLAWTLHTYTVTATGASTVLRFEDAGIGYTYTGGFLDNVSVVLAVVDTDSDGVNDDVDNCPDDANNDQADLDEDGVGDVCDPDADGDGELPPLDCNDLDPGIYTTAIEMCSDGIDNDCDLLVDAADDGADCDGDTIPNAFDNCPDDANPGQADLDNDGAGDVCDPDDDGDGYEDDMDNCPVVANDQADFDMDGVGDACDADADGDSVDDVADLCLSTAPSDTDAGVPSKRLGKNRWADIDGDGLFDTSGKNPTGRYYTIDDTAGCNCAQIIEACGYGQGHTKHGCSNSVMDWWTGSSDREGEPPYQCKD